MRILLVDDSRLLRTMLRRSLRQCGLTVTRVAEAETGQDALDLLKRERFDLVLCDYCMPEMDGKEFLVAATKELRHMPKVLVVSAQAGPEIGDLVRREGSSGYLRKPFTAEELRHAIDMAMQ